MGPAQRHGALWSAGRTARASVSRPRTLARRVAQGMGQVRPARASWRRLVSQPLGLAWAHLLWLEKPQAGHGGAPGPRMAAGETLVFCPIYARGACEPPSTVVGLGHGCESVVSRHNHSWRALGVWGGVPRRCWGLTARSWR